MVVGLNRVVDTTYRMSSSPYLYIGQPASERTEKAYQGSSPGDAKLYMLRHYEDASDSPPSLVYLPLQGPNAGREITATGGGGHTDYVGELLIDTTPNDQDTTVPITRPSSM